MKEQLVLKICTSQKRINKIAKILKVELKGSRTDIIKKISEFSYSAIKQASFQLN